MSSRSKGVTKVASSRWPIVVADLVAAVLGRPDLGRPRLRLVVGPEHRLEAGGPRRGRSRHPRRTGRRSARRGGSGGVARWSSGGRRWAGARPADGRDRPGAAHARRGALQPIGDGDRVPRPRTAVRCSRPNGLDLHRLRRAARDRAGDRQRRGPSTGSDSSMRPVRRSLRTGAPTATPDEDPRRRPPDAGPPAPRPPRPRRSSSSTSRSATPPISPTSWASASSASTTTAGSSSRTRPPTSSSAGRRRACAAGRRSRPSSTPGSRT